LQVAGGKRERRLAVGAAARFQICHLHEMGQQQRRFHQALRGQGRILAGNGLHGQRQGVARAQRLGRVEHGRAAFHGRPADPELP
jgi:hypothetical protein